MNWKEQALNRKGFLHHPETPPEDKAFYIQHKEKARQLLEIGIKFLREERVLSWRSTPSDKEKWGLFKNTSMAY